MGNTSTSQQMPGGFAHSDTGSSAPTSEPPAGSRETQKEKNTETAGSTKPRGGPTVLSKPTVVADVSPAPRKSLLEFSETVSEASEPHRPLPYGANPRLHHQEYYPTWPNGCPLEGTFKQTAYTKLKEDKGRPATAQTSLFAGLTDMQRSSRLFSAPSFGETRAFQQIYETPAPASINSLEVIELLPKDLSDLRQVLENAPQHLNDDIYQTLRRLEHCILPIDVTLGADMLYSLINAVENLTASADPLGIGKLAERVLRRLQYYRERWDTENKIWVKRAFESGQSYAQPYTVHIVNNEHLRARNKPAGEVPYAHHLPGMLRATADKKYKGEELDTFRGFHVNDSPPAVPNNIFAAMMARNKVLDAEPTNSQGQSATLTSFDSLFAEAKTVEAGVSARKEEEPEENGQKLEEKERLPPDFDPELRARHSRGQGMPIMIHNSTQPKIQPEPTTIAKEASRVQEHSCVDNKAALIGEPSVTSHPKVNARPPSRERRTVPPQVTFNQLVAGKSAPSNPLFTAKPALLDSLIADKPAPPNALIPAKPAPSNPLLVTKPAPSNALTATELAPVNLFASASPSALPPKPPKPPSPPTSPFPPAPPAAVVGTNTQKSIAISEHLKKDIIAPYISEITKLKQSLVTLTTQLETSATNLASLEKTNAAQEAALREKHAELAALRTSQRRRLDEKLTEVRVQHKADIEAQRARYESKIDEASEKLAQHVKDTARIDELKSCVKEVEKERDDLIQARLAVRKEIAELKIERVELVQQRTAFSDAYEHVKTELDRLQARCVEVEVERDDLLDKLRELEAAAVLSRTADEARQVSTSTSASQQTGNETEQSKEIGKQNGSADRQVRPTTQPAPHDAPRLERLQKQWQTRVTEKWDVLNSREEEVQSLEKEVRGLEEKVPAMARRGVGAGAVGGQMMKAGAVGELPKKVVAMSGQPRKANAPQGGGVMWSNVVAGRHGRAGRK